MALVDLSDDPVRHKHRALLPEEKLAVEAVKDAGLALILTLDKFCHPGRDKSLAVTKAEEAVMWAVKGITR